MIRMVPVNKLSVAFCKYVIAGLLWLAILLQSTLPIYVVFALMFISAFTGVHKAPLVLLFDFTFAKAIPPKQIYINLHSMRFAHMVGCGFCVLALLSYYFISPAAGFIMTAILAVMQTIASFGYCSAQKLYECVICNSNCCRFGKKIRSMKKDA